MNTKATVSLTMRPHCTKQNQRSCPLFAVTSPLNIQTQSLNVGDTLDMDILIQNTGKLPLQRGRVWLSYDPTILEGTAIVPGSYFPVPTPDLKDFDAEKGFAKIEMQTAKNAAHTGTLLPLAQVTFTVIASPPGGVSILSFYDADTSEPHTAVLTGEAAPRNVLSPRLGSLTVQIESAEGAEVPPPEGFEELPVITQIPASSSIPAVTVPTDSTLSEEPAETTDAEGMHRSAFVLLQVQNLRLTTEDGSLYVAWDALAAPGIRGYNVYYGTQAGRYIQRRSVEASEHTMSIRSLPAGTAYYVAIRGINEQNEETAFSQEVSVTIGDPATSTSPLRQDDLSTGKNLVQERGGSGGVPGESGLPSTALLLLLGSAVIGTMFALRRQSVALHAPLP